MLKAVLKFDHTIIRQFVNQRLQLVMHEIKRDCY